MGQRESRGILINFDKWDDRFMEMAKLVSTWSKDPSTKVGCVIVDTMDRRIISTGYNGLPREIDDDMEKHPERHDREKEKYLHYIHAETNAIYNAVRTGVSLLNTTAYVTMAPCMSCAGAIIQSGIGAVVYNEEFTNEYMKKNRLDINKSIEYLAEAGVYVYSI